MSRPLIFFKMILTFILLLLFADSTVLAHVMKVLNERHSYGLDLILLSVDEGITGYRDDSLEVLFQRILLYRMLHYFFFIIYFQRLFINPSSAEI